MWRLMPDQSGKRLAQTRGVEQGSLVVGLRIDPPNNGVFRCAFYVPKAAAVGHPVRIDRATFDVRGKLQIAAIHILARGLVFRLGVYRLCNQDQTNHCTHYWSSSHLHLQIRF